MKDGLFWRVMAVLALCVALAYVVSLHMQPQPAAAGGEGGYIMEVVGDHTNARAYVLDASRKVLLLYAGTNRDRNGFSLISARWIDIDSQAPVGKEQVPTQPNGYTVQEMKRISEQQQVR